MKLYVIEQQTTLELQWIADFDVDLLLEQSMLQPYSHLERLLLIFLGSKSLSEDFLSHKFVEGKGGGGSEESISNIDILLIYVDCTSQP